MICDYCFDDMDDDGHVVVIEQPDGAMRDTPVRVARNGGAGQVRSNAEGSKSASAPVRTGKFKKQRVAPGKYVRPKEPAIALALMMKTFSLICIRKPNI